MILCNNQWQCQRKNVWHFLNVINPSVVFSISHQFFRFQIPKVCDLFEQSFLDIKWNKNRFCRKRSLDTVYAVMLTLNSSKKGSRTFWALTFSHLVFAWLAPNIWPRKFPRCLEFLQVLLFLVFLLNSRLFIKNKQ